MSFPSFHVCDRVVSLIYVLCTELSIYLWSKKFTRLALRKMKLKCETIISYFSNIFHYL